LIEHVLFQRDHGWKWRYIELLYTEAAQKIDSRYKAMSLFGRNRYLLDILHILGASLIGVYVGMALYLALKVYKEEIWLPGHLIVLVLSLGVLVFLLDREDKAKKDVEKTGIVPHDADSTDPIPAFSWKLNKLVTLDIVHPGSMFIFFWICFHLFANPFLTPPMQGQMDVMMKFALIILSIFAWVYSKRKCSTSTMLGEAAGLVGTLLLAYISCRIVCGMNIIWDWPYLSSLFLFFSANIVLMKNRQNTRDDVIAMEYYTLRRYLTDGEPKEVLKSA
jgi:hypothetical protein